MTGGRQIPDALARRLGAEALGTFCLVFAGTGAVAVDAASGGKIGHGGVAMAFGVVVGVMILALGRVSGAHLNPAVTVSLAAVGRLPRREVVPYAIAQVLGALCASAALAAMFGRASGLGATHPAHVGAGAAFALELGLTAVLVVVILAAADDAPPARAPVAAAVAVGGTIALAALVLGPVTGASMNPARSLAPAAVARDPADLWLYLTAPVAGALAGVIVHRAMRGHVATSVLGRRSA